MIGASLNRTLVVLKALRERIAGLGDVIPLNRPLVVLKAAQVVSLRYLTQRRL